ncbi:MAG: hypothetical protein ACPGEG_04500 [Salibacteraceae bacterium]
MLRICFILLFLFIGLFAKAQSEFSPQLFSAYIKSDMPAWKVVIDKMQNDKRTKRDTNFTAELVQYQYGYVAWHLGYHLENEAEKYLEIADENLDWLREQGYNPSMVESYQASFYGFWIGVNTWYFTLYGFKCPDAAKLAIELNPNNPFAYIQWGNIKYYQPAFVGGSKPEAIEYYKKAEKMYESRGSSKINSDWIYLNLLATLAQAHERFKHYDEAKSYYLKLLDLQPDYVWVKDTMLPNLEIKMNQLELE